MNTRTVSLLLSPARHRMLVLLVCTAAFFAPLAIATKPADAQQQPVKPWIQGTFRDLGMGSTGPDVRALQDLLNKIAGAGLSIDGQYGPATYRSVVNFQRFMGVSPDNGLVGWKTREALFAAEDNRVARGNPNAAPGYGWDKGGFGGLKINNFTRYNSISGFPLGNIHSTTVRNGKHAVIVPLSITRGCFWYFTWGGTWSHITFTGVCQ